MFQFIIVIHTIISSRIHFCFSGRGTCYSELHNRNNGIPVDAYYLGTKNTNQNYTELAR